MKLAKAGEKVAGLGFSSDLVTGAKSLLKHSKILPLGFMLGSGIFLPARDNSFDKVLCVGVLDYIRDFKASLHELYRVTKGNGMVFLLFLSKVRLFCIKNEIQRLFKENLFVLAAHYYKSY